MKRRLISLAVTAMVMMAFVSVTLALPSPVSAGGATQIRGVGFWAAPGQCNDLEGQGADLVLRMTGDLQGCHYIFIESTVCAPSGAFRLTGNEVFVSQANSNDSFRTKINFEGKYKDCNPAVEIFGRCQHPIIEGSGKGIFEGVTGRLDFKDNVEDASFPYRGHFQY